MQTHPRWNAAGEPALTANEREGMSDFWTTYDAHYDQVQKALLDGLGDLPDLAGVVGRMSADELARNSQRSRELTRQAAMDNVWGPLLEHHRSQAEGYATHGVRLREWFELMSDFQRVMLPLMIQRLGATGDRMVGAILAMNRFLDITMGTMVEAYLVSKEKLIAQQQQEIHDLSTPVLQVRDRLLLLPMVGLIDTQRARLLTQHLLQAIRHNRARVVVIDITGVPAVDSKVANHLLQTVAAARLMGATAVVTGLSAEVAQAMVTLGVDLSGLNTVGDLQGGLEEAERLLGVRVASGAEHPAPALNGSGAHLGL